MMRVIMPYHHPQAWLSRMHLSRGSIMIRIRLPFASGGIVKPLWPMYGFMIEVAAEQKFADEMKPYIWHGSNPRVCTPVAERTQDSRIAVIRPGTWQDDFRITPT